MSLRGSLPNVVLVMADDQGWGDVGFNFPNSRDTPFLDSLAQRSFVGLDHHSGASVCSPSRAALLTGRMAPRTGVWRNFDAVAAGGLTTNETVLAEYFKQQHYATAIHGKWSTPHTVTTHTPLSLLSSKHSHPLHRALSVPSVPPVTRRSSLATLAHSLRHSCVSSRHLGTVPPFHPSFRGFDEYLGVPFSIDMGCVDGHPANYPPPTPCPKDPPNSSFLYYEHDHERPEDADLSIALPLYQCLSPMCADGGGDCNRDIIEQPVNLSNLSTHYIEGDRRFIQQAVRAGRPFFLYLPLSHMHVPHAVAPEWVGKGALHNVYGDTLRELDWHMNRTFSLLVEEGVVNDTLFIYTSDNGPWNYKCDLAGNWGPFSGAWQWSVEGGNGGGTGKFTTWEAGHRVPFLAHWPGRIPPRRSRALTSNLDLLPTLLSLIDVPLPTNRSFDGQDIGAVLFDGSEQGHTFLFHPDQNGTLTAMRYQQYKAFYQTYSAAACGAGVQSPVRDHYPPLVFDLSADEGESHPISVSADLLAVLDKALAAKRADIASTPRSKPDYRQGDLDDRPCCDAGHIVCRCTN